VFRRADTVWMVFDTEATVAITSLNAELGKTLRGASTTRVDAVALVRVKLERPQLISVVADGNAWVVTFANEVVEPTRPLQITRNVAASARSSVSIGIDSPRKLHRLDDPDVGNRYLARKDKNGVSFVVLVEDDADHYEGRDPRPGLDKVA